MPGLPYLFDCLLGLTRAPVSFRQRDTAIARRRPAHLIEPRDFLRVVERGEVDIFFSPHLQRRHERPVGTFTQQRRHLIERHVLVTTTAKPDDEIANGVVPRLRLQGSHRAPVAAVDRGNCVAENPRL